MIREHEEVRSGWKKNAKITAWETSSLNNTEKWLAVDIVLKYKCLDKRRPGNVKQMFRWETSA